MSKTLQLRCPNCNRLLIKWAVGAKDCVYKVVELDDEYKCNCTKCNLRLVFKEYEFVPDTGHVAVKA